jgi:putative iron-dependent peroxidase
MSEPQPGILEPLPRHARYLTFELAPDADPRAALDAVGACDPGQGVVGIGLPLARALGAEIDGLRDLEPHSGPGFSVPATPAALWCWLRGDDRGELVHAARALESSLDEHFALDLVVDGFVHLEGRDLTGYVDGTENPTGDDAARVALADGAGTTAAGSSFVAVQQWMHDLDAFERHTRTDRDLIIGRRRTDDVEIDDAPASAHVKRTAQEDFDPPAFLLRRSMPWADGDGEGLMFVAFGRSLDPFERQLRRMVGADDGIVDALFSFARPVTSAAFWCPPVTRGRLDVGGLA